MNPGHGTIERRDPTMNNKWMLDVLKCVKSSSRIDFIPELLPCVKRDAKSDSTPNMEFFAIFEHKIAF